MNVTINIDCTPEEARRFMGLPDLTAVHQAYVDKVQKTIAEGITADMLAEMTRNWGPMTEASMSMWHKLVDQMSGARP